MTSWKVTAQTNGWCIHTDDKDKSHITDVDNKEIGAKICTEHNAHEALVEALKTCDKALVDGVIFQQRPNGSQTRFATTAMQNLQAQIQAALRQAGR